MGTEKFDFKVPEQGLKSYGYKDWVNRFHGLINFGKGIRKIQKNEIGFYPVFKGLGLPIRLAGGIRLKTDWKRLMKSENVEMGQAEADGSIVGGGDKYDMDILPGTAMIGDTQGNKDLKQLFGLDRLEIVGDQEVIIGKGKSILRISWQGKDGFKDVNRLLLGAMLLSEEQLGLAGRGLLVTDQKDNEGSIIGLPDDELNSLRAVKLEGSSIIKVKMLLTKMWDKPVMGVIID